MLMTFDRLKRISKPKQTRLKFDLGKLKDPNVLEKPPQWGAADSEIKVPSGENTA